MAKPLTDLAIRALTSKGLHRDGATKGLYLAVAPKVDRVTGESAVDDDGKPIVTRAWVYRFMLDLKSRAMGLGPYPDIDLATARELARQARTKVKLGVDPIDARNVEREARRAEHARRHQPP